MESLEDTIEETTDSILEKQKELAELEDSLTGAERDLELGKIDEMCIRDRLSSRRSVQSIRPSLEKIRVFLRGWLNYYGIADMKKRIDDLNSWLYHRIRMCIWKQWKKPKTKKRNLMKLGIPGYFAHQAANSRKKHWYVSGMGAVNRALTKERLINSGFYDLATAYQSVHVNY